MIEEPKDKETMLTDPFQYSVEPPQPSNEMGVVKPVFDPKQQITAQGIFGDVTQRQNSLGINTPLFKKYCNK